MELLVIICNQPEKLNQVVEFLAQNGAPGATVIESEGMGKLVSADAPLLAMYGHLLSSVHPHNHTILSVVESGEQAARLLRALERRDGEARDAGLAFSVPLSGYVPLRTF